VTGRLATASRGFRRGGYIPAHGSRRSSAGRGSRADVRVPWFVGRHAACPYGRTAMDRPPTHDACVARPRVSRPIACGGPLPRRGVHPRPCRPPAHRATACRARRAGGRGDRGPRCDAPCVQTPVPACMRPYLSVRASDLPHLPAAPSAGVMGCTSPLRARASARLAKCPRTDLRTALEGPGIGFATARGTRDLGEAAAQERRVSRRGPAVPS
jgi:hypothetical protein